MASMVLLSVGAGLGLALLVHGWLPPQPALARQLAALTTHDLSPDRRGLLSPATQWLRAAGLPSPATTRDLAVLDRTTDDHLTQKTALTLAGLLTPPSVAAGLALLGADVDLGTCAVVALACGIAGFILPDHRVRRAAARRRTDFRHALSAYLDLVVISLAGGAGVDSALNDAVRIGHGWAFTQINCALAGARLTRTSPWIALQRLGQALGISELAELAASLNLAGTEGAKVRRSLHAKAAALRARQLTDAEGNASADTERMSVPVMVLFLGFLGFITYPAMNQVLTGL